MLFYFYYKGRKVYYKRPYNEAPPPFQTHVRLSDIHRHSTGNRLSFFWFCLNLWKFAYRYRSHIYIEILVARSCNLFSFLDFSEALSNFSLEEKKRSICTQSSTFVQNCIFFVCIEIFISPNLILLILVIFSICRRLTKWCEQQTEYFSAVFICYIQL
jgi:hypothetical protein